MLAVLMGVSDDACQVHQSSVQEGSCRVKMRIGDRSINAMKEWGERLIRSSLGWGGGMRQINCTVGEDFVRLYSVMS